MLYYTYIYLYTHQTDLVFYPLRLRDRDQCRSVSDTWHQRRVTALEKTVESKSNALFNKTTPPQGRASSLTCQNYLSLLLVVLGN